MQTIISRLQDEIKVTKQANNKLSSTVCILSLFSFCLFQLSLLSWYPTCVSHFFLWYYKQRNNTLPSRNWKIRWLHCMPAWKRHTQSSQPTLASFLMVAGRTIHHLSVNTAKNLSQWKSVWCVHTSCIHVINFSKSTLPKPEILYFQFLFSRHKLHIFHSKYKKIWILRL